MEMESLAFFKQDAEGPRSPLGRRKVWCAPSLRFGDVLEEYVPQAPGFHGSPDDCDRTWIEEAVQHTASRGSQNSCQPI